MYRGLYTAGIGMETQMTRLNVLGNNLANLRTPGFKEQMLTLTPFPMPVALRQGPSGTVPLGPLPTGVQVAQSSIRASANDAFQGSLQRTNNPLDVALTGPGFFQVRTPAGNLRYTRDGQFQVDSAGNLVTSQGDLVMGTQGPLKPGTGSLTIAPNGALLQAGKTVGTLAVYTFPTPQALALAPSGLYQPTAASGTATLLPNPSLQPGYLESSNVSETRTLTSILDAYRSYQSDSQTVSAENQVLGLAATQVGVV